MVIIIIMASPPENPEPLECRSHIFCSPVYSEHLAQWLAIRRHLINIGQMVTPSHRLRIWLLTIVPFSCLSAIEGNKGSSSGQGKSFPCALGHFPSRPLHCLVPTLPDVASIFNLSFLPFRMNVYSGFFQFSKQIKTNQKRVPKNPSNRPFNYFTYWTYMAEHLQVLSGIHQHFRLCRWLT